MITRDLTWAQWNRAWWDHQGMVGGRIGGAACLLFELAASALQLGVNGIFDRFRLRASLLLGPEALGTDTAVGPVLVIGTLIHFALAAVFGLCFGALVGGRSRLIGSPGMLVLTATGYGLALWLTNYYAVAPTLGLAWIPEESRPLIDGPAYALGFGLPLAWWLVWAIRRRRRLGLL